MTTYYVSSTAGNDGNVGTSSATPLATLQAAANHTRPGDVVQVMSGTYSAPSSAYDVLDIRTSGTAAAPIVYEAAPGQHPIINSSGHSAGIVVEGASYITISGFEVTGNAGSLNQSYALSHQGQASTSTKGVAVWESGGRTPTHVTIRGNIVHDQPGAGVWAGHGDYLSILNNTVYRNALWSSNADSGISVGWMKSTDANTGYKTIISGNIVHDNRENIPWSSTGSITDGNGIIVDSNNATGYNGRTLVENNVLYGNGGTGAHAIASSNVDFIYNTSYNNNQSPGLQEGQIIANGSTSVRIENNIMSSSPGGVVNGSSNGVTYDYNVYFGGTVRTQGAHDIVANPGFVSPGTNFTLGAGSPAIDTGTAAFMVPNDVAGNGRPVGAGYDRGAYEYQGTGASSTQTAPTVPSPAPAVEDDTLVLNLSADLYNGPPQFIVALDDKELGPAKAVSATHNSGKGQDFSFAGIFGTGPHDVAISFINDAYGGTPQTDRNLYINSISFDGHSYAHTASLFSAGTVHFSIPSNTAP